MVRLVKINSKNVWDVIKLDIDDSQKNYVATNTESIIEAYTTIAANGVAYPFGIYDGDLLVGFLMIGYGIDDDWDNAPEFAKNAYSLWRLMIDFKYQRKGYGRQAMKAALDFIKTFPNGPAEHVYLSYMPDNIAARNLYLSLGFEETDEKEDDEVVAILKL